MVNLTRREAEALLADLGSLIAQAEHACQYILDHMGPHFVPLDARHLAAAVDAVDDSLARLDKKGVAPHV
jgi:hypothetical protein